MEKWLVEIGTKSYQVEEDTRSKAINRAAHLYREETCAPYSIPTLMAAAHARKASRNFVKPELEEVQ